MAPAKVQNEAFPGHIFTSSLPRPQRNRTIESNETSFPSEESNDDYQSHDECAREIEKVLVLLVDCIEYADNYQKQSIVQKVVI
jgi:hypothetical protein